MIKDMALLLFVLTSLFASPAITLEPLYYNCSTNRSSTENFTRNSTYNYNLNHLLSTLSSNALATGYASYSTGTIPDYIYGLFLCRGDTNSDSCHSCISNAISDIKEHCPISKDAIIWYDYCQLSYANLDYRFDPDIKNNIKVLMINTQTISGDQLLRFKSLTIELLGILSDLPTILTSQPFATGETALTATVNIYGMVQCTRDLSVGDCQTCLQGSKTEITSSPMRGKSGGTVLGLWCYMRYEIYKFYNGTSTLQYSSNESQLSTNGSTPNTTRQLADLSHGGKKTMMRSIAIFLPLGLVLILSTLICLILKRKKREEGRSNSQWGQTPSTQGTDLASQLKITEGNLEFSLMNFSTIVEATCNFYAAKKLGQGGFGSVYKGQLPEGKYIAVKRLDAFSGQGLEEFMNEIKLIAKLQHQNLVKLLGCCVQGDEKLLVYEYMPNNSLDYHLFDPVRKEQLDWPKRFAIIDGIAQGLLYLHKYSRVRIIHRDLKASNILLDLEMNPKISDFGMARIFDANTTQANTNRIVGTYGYMSPEYAMEGLFSIKSDVFSFGVLMLEIISGKRNTTFHKSGKALNLLAHAWALWKNGNWLDFVDPSLGDKIVINDLLKCIIIALMCVQENAIDRPIMSEIITMFGSENTALPEPKKPAFFIVGKERVLDFASQNDITLTVLEGR